MIQHLCNRAKRKMQTFKLDNHVAISYPGTTCIVIQLWLIFWSTQDMIARNASYQIQSESTNSVLSYCKFRHKLISTLHKAIGSNYLAMIIVIMSNYISAY